VELLLVAPVVTALICFLMPRWKWTAIVSVLGSSATVVAAAPICYEAFKGDAVVYSLWYFDGLSALFVIITACIGLLVSVYSYGYMKRDINDGRTTTRDGRSYFVIFQLFVFAMILVCVVDSVGILWIAIEATTLISAFLVGFYKTEGATEAAWKYLMICSVGIVLALFGITLLYASSLNTVGDTPNSLDWSILVSIAPELDPGLIKVAFIFILIGFGTKMGLVPMHTWLPDAHSQSPTPVSAMLSAVLLNCALYAILRFRAIADLTVPGFTSSLLIGFGLVSMIVAAFFIIISKNIKRMFAYSSIEHMGIIAIGFGIGTPLAMFGALFHIIAHSLTKSAAFFSVGNIIQEYGTTNMNEIRGMRKKMPFTSFAITLSSLAIIGLPPFAVFIGEISIIKGMADAGMYALIALFVILLIMVFAGFIRNVFPMLSGTADNDASGPLGASKTVPIVILIIATLFFGLFMPEEIREVLESMVPILSGGRI
jgi:hydrogenase-4 component F